jgi:5'-deoxynucleotidase YfbR-like HD superfamily hydrolase
MEIKDLINITTITKDEEIMGPHIDTFSGKRICFTNPKPEDISIIDIAHSLSNICRFTGHTKKFYSVAQHSVLVSDAQKTIAEKRAGLLHDATECYLNDLASPLKVYLKGCGYSDLEILFHNVINDKYNVNGGMTPNIKKGDLQALFTEKRDLCKGKFSWGDEIVRFKKKIKPLKPKKAKELFLKRFVELFPEEAKEEGLI